MEFNFNDNKIVDSLDKVPDQFRSVYVQSTEDNTKFVIDTKYLGVTGAIDGINKALKNERKLSNELKSKKDVSVQLKELFDLESLDEVKTKFSEMETTILEKSKVDPAKIKADIEKGYLTKEKALNDKNAAMFESLRQHMIIGEANAALNELKGSVPLLMPIIKEAATVVEDNGSYVVRVKDDSGSYRGNQSGGFMTISDYVKELKNTDAYKPAFAASSPNGTGTKPSNQPGVNPTPSDTSPLSLIERGLREQQQG